MACCNNAWHHNVQKYAFLLCIIQGWTFSCFLLRRRFKRKGFNFWSILTCILGLKPWMQVRYAVFQCSGLQFSSARHNYALRCSVAPAQLCSDIMDCIISANCSLAFFCNTPPAPASCSTITAAAKKFKGRKVAQVLWKLIVQYMHFHAVVPPTVLHQYMISGR